MKHLLIRFATGISVSHAIAAHVSTTSTVIPNAYREDIFQKLPLIERDRELVFLGRLVSDKGADLLLLALAKLKACGLRPRLTVIGDGPEKAALGRQAKDLGIYGQVDFVGVKVEKELADLLNAHRILIAPSRVQEGFGIVTLEGIACGCVVVGSDSGGLKEAIGPCGLTFPNGDAEALAQSLFRLLTEAEELSKYRAQADAHLARHRGAEVARAYLQVFEKALRGERAQKQLASESLKSTMNAE